MEDAARLIERDVGLASKVLQLVNSGMFGLQRSVGSLQQALQLLGLKLVRDLVLSSELLGDLGSCSLLDEISPIPPERLGFLIAAASRTVAPRAALETTFTAGLLCRIGRLVLVTRSPDRFLRVLEHLERGRTLCEAEEEIYSIDSQTLGAWLLASWGLPHEVVEAVRWCERPERASGRAAPLALSIYLASRLVEEAAWASVGRQVVRIRRVELEPWGLADSLEAWRAQAQRRGESETPPQQRRRPVSDQPTLVRMRKRHAVRRPDGSLSFPEE